MSTSVSAIPVLYPPKEDMVTVILSTIWVFQAVLAAPIFICLGIAAIANLITTFDTVYDFFNHVCNSIFAGAIIFIVVIQRRLLRATVPLSPFDIDQHPHPQPSIPPLPSPSSSAAALHHPPPPPDPVSKSLTLRLELLKLLFATLLWIWLLMDSIFGPNDHYSDYRGRPTRIRAAVLSVVLLAVFFWPAVGFAVWDLRRGEGEGEVVGKGDEEGEGAAEEAVVGERTPLLG